MNTKVIINKTLEAAETISFKSNVPATGGISFQVVTDTLVNSGGYVRVSQSLDENATFTVLRKLYFENEGSEFTFSIDEYEGEWLKVDVVSGGSTAENVTVTMGDGAQFVSPWGTRKVTVEFTRPANSSPDYAINDVIGNAGATAIKLTGVVKKPGGSGKIVGLSLMKDNANAGTSLRLHMYSSSPTVIADNEPFALLYANKANRIASRDLVFATEGTGSNAAYCELQDVNIPFKCNAGSTDITLVLQTKVAFTPVSGAKYYITALIDENPA